MRKRPHPGGVNPSPGSTTPIGPAQEAARTVAGGEAVEGEPRANDSRGLVARLVRAVAVVVIGVAIAAVVASRVPADNHIDIVLLELAGTGEQAAEVLDAAIAEGDTGQTRADVVALVREQLDQDDTEFIPAYTIGLAAALILLLVIARVVAGAWPRWTTVVGVSIAAVLVAAGLDVLENDRLRAGLDGLATVRPGDAIPPATDAVFAVASFAAGTKFALLLLALGVLVSLAVVFVWTGFVPPPARRSRQLRPKAMEAEWTPADGKIGISCSGGGVRSATFCLGALQVLEEKGVLCDAKYVTAVSGGGYIAAGHAIAYGASDPDIQPQPPKPPILGRGSPEEHWVRLHSSHLVASSLVFMAAALRLIVGIVFGWFLIWLLLFAIGRPVGWLISSSAVHPELRARTPILETVTQPSLVGAPEVSFVEENRTADTPYAVYVFDPAYSCAELRAWETITDDSSKLVPAGLTTVGPGAVRVERGEATIVDQPTIEVAEGVAEQPTEAGGGLGVCDVEAGVDPFASSSQNAEGPAVVMSTDSVFTLDSQAFRTTPRLADDDASPEAIAAVVAAALEEETAPTVTHRSGMTGRESISIAYWQWLTGLVLVVVGLVLYSVRMLWRPFSSGVRRTLEQSSALLSLTGAFWLLVLVVLPWCIQEIPPFLSELLHIGGDKGGASGDGATGLDAVLATLGITGLLAVAVRSTGQFALKQGKAHLPLLTRVMVGIVLPLIGAMVFLDLLEFATANGRTGAMLGFGIGMSLADLPFASDAARWCLVLVLLAALATVDAHSWSLYPFYKRRLSEAYAVARDKQGNVNNVRYEDGPILIKGVVGDDSDPSWWSDTSWWPGHPKDRESGARKRSHARLAPLPDPPAEKPQLVMCCAASVSDRSLAPPGRRSVSFTVSNDWIGSELGWMETSDYLKRLGKRRLSDLTLPSLMAISGAAVSPGMGKMSRGPLDSLFALLNVRLGVWLPNPAIVNENKDKERPGDKIRRWRRLPWWGWYLCEVVGRFPGSASYLYVADGGHWENLGLVELFRRGCTRIYCISAAGDGPESFATIGEALALAREEFGVEMELDLTKLRRPTKAPDPVVRPFRRLAKAKSKTDEKLVEADWALAGYVAGKFRYTGTPPVEGEIVILEANLAGDVPWDVQTWAERNDAFPDDPTSDQLFSHRQFESYLALGRAQMEAAPWPSATATATTATAKTATAPKAPATDPP